MDEYEKLSMDNDYEDACGEVYGQKRAETKDDIIYGTFGSGDSDDGSGSKKRRKGESKPVSFVSAGLSKDEKSGGLGLATAAGKMMREGGKLREEKARLRLAKRESDPNGLGEYTKGIGTKLFKKMSHKGGGLGINEQGILAPLEVNPRPPKMGLGFGYPRPAKTAPRPSQSYLNVSKWKLLGCILIVVSIFFWFTIIF